MHKHTYTHIFPSSLQGRKGHAPPHPWPALTREEPQRWPQHEHYHVPYPSPGPCSPSASPTSTSWPLGSGIWQGGCWLTTSQGRNGWAGKHTHTHTHRAQGQVEAGPASSSPCCPTLPDLCRHTRPPTRPHNTTLFVVLKLLPLGGPPPGPIPSLYSRPRPRSNISHLILQLCIIRLPFSLLLFVRCHIGVISLC